MAFRPIIQFAGGLTMLAPQEIQLRQESGMSLFVGSLRGGSPLRILGTQHRQRGDSLVIHPLQEPDRQFLIHMDRAELGDVPSLLKMVLKITVSWCFHPLSYGTSS